MKKIIILVLFLLSASAAFADGPGAWKGYVAIDSSNASSGVTVIAYVDDSYNSNTTTGELQTKEDNYYAMGVVGASGKKVIFKIYGINASSEQDWSEGPNELNLSINKSADGAACTWSLGCTGGYCCSGSTQRTGGSGSGTCQSSACSSSTSGGGSGSSSSGSSGGGGTITNTSSTEEEPVEQPSLPGSGSDTITQCRTDSDCDDNNPDTVDKCDEIGKICYNYIPDEGVQEKPSADGPEKEVTGESAQPEKKRSALPLGVNIGLLVVITVLAVFILLHAKKKLF